MTKIIRKLTGKARHLRVSLPHMLMGYTRDRKTLKWLRDEIRSNITQMKITQILESNLNVQDYCERYNENISTSVYDSVERHFDEVQRSIMIPGWPQGQYPPHASQPPITEIGKLGEGLIGWYLESKLGMRLIHRPVGVCPDALMENGGSIALIEIKTTTSIPGPLRKSVETTIISAATDIVDLWAKIRYITGSNPYEGYATNVKLMSIANITPIGSNLDVWFDLLSIKFI